MSAQLSKRAPRDAVYCSCRCAGPDPDFKYCACPATFECVELVRHIPALGEWSALEGSYCVKEGTAYQAGVDYGPPCHAGDAGALPCGGYDGR